MVAGAPSCHVSTVLLHPMPYNTHLCNHLYMPGQQQNPTCTAMHQRKLYIVRAQFSLRFELKLSANTVSCIQQGCGKANCEFLPDDQTGAGSASQAWRRTARPGHHMSADHTSRSCAPWAAKSQQSNSTTLMIQHGNCMQANV
jgi:hypothetical protein